MLAAVDLKYISSNERKHLQNISYASGALTLNDKHHFPSFMRTFTTSYLKFKGVAQLLLHFGWNWIGMLAEDDDYGREVSQLLRQQFIESKICIEFFESIPLVNLEIKIPYLITIMEKSSSKAVVIVSSDSRLYPVMKEAARANLSKKLWVGSEDWPDSLLFSKEEFYRTLQGTLWISAQTGPMPGFQDFLYKLSPLKNADDKLTQTFWEHVFGCQWNNAAVNIMTNNNVTICTGTENLKLLNIPFFDVTRVSFTYNVYNAIYATAKALHSVLSCKPGMGPFFNRTCTSRDSIEPWHFFHYLRNVNFIATTGDQFQFDEMGNPPDIYDILNWQVKGNDSVRYVKVGSFNSKLSKGGGLSIDIDSIIWRENKAQVPHSVCSDACISGYRMANEKGKPACCFNCILCSEGEISNQTGSTECLSCPDDFWSNESRDRCIKKTVEFLSYEDPLGVLLASLSGCFSILTIAIFAVFFKNKDTPVVKANNRELSYVFLCGLVLCFLGALLMIGIPSKVVCLLQQVAFGTTFVLCVSCVLAKTVMVIIAFKATNPNSNLKRWVGTTLPNTVVVICTLLQCVLCITWITISPPFPEWNKKTQLGKLLIKCNNGSTVAFWCMLGYIGLLSVVSFIVAFLARNLPDSFNETKFLTFSMIVCVSVWLSFIPAYLSTQGKYMVAVEVFAILSSTAGLLTCIFLPKCYIILFKPEKNTREYLMGKKSIE
ncbi:extracellular calcium-sensing receptor-like [Protopterus annectens]|uniref:extracellular calcium-sensing receptor-like n=1 Tax=Protopterus annectens TaxID=7888 RepID=UPI001CFC28CC|nr:extracellular calcium-sensing receptor-like [Protopterus annectens]